MTHRPADMRGERSELVGVLNGPHGGAGYPGAE
jgi:hypothetical protein